MRVSRKYQGVDCLKATLVSQITLYRLIGEGLFIHVILLRI